MTEPTEERRCHHLMHLPSGKCLGCGEQHQPLADYQPGDDEKYTREHLAEEPEAARPTTDVSTELVTIIDGLLSDHLAYAPAYDCVAVSRGDLEKIRTTIEALQRSNAEKDERELKLLRDIERLVVQRAEKDEVLRQMRENERRNCINWGPCSQHDTRMEPGPIPSDVVEAIRNVDYWEGNCGDLVDFVTDKLRKALEDKTVGGETDAVHQ